VDLQETGVDSSIKVVFKEGVDASMLEDKVLERVANIGYRPRLILV